MDRPSDVVPSSPTISSPSSSDLDTQSTGSFFHDRSTTLGTLMGVSLFQPAAAAPPTSPPRRRTARKRPSRRWWRLCREKDVCRTSLADFLKLERRLSGGAGEISAAAQFLYGGEAEIDGDPLFRDGKVLPPKPTTRRHDTLARLPVMLVGICSGGDG